MTIKNLFLAGALMVASLTLASAKTYDFSLAAPSQVGPITLAAGHYTLKMLGGDVVEFTNLDTNKKAMVEVKINNLGDKVDATSVNLKDEAGTQRVTSIDLQDTGSKLEF